MEISVKFIIKNKSVEESLDSFDELKVVFEKSGSEITSIAIRDAEVPDKTLETLLKLITSNVQKPFELELNDIQIDPRLFKYLIELLNNNRLTGLILPDSIPNETCFANICIAARKCTSLRSLDLQGFAKISNETLTELCEMIKENLSLNELLVSQLDLKREQVFLLLKTLRRNSTLSYFYLADSKLTEKEWALLEKIQTRNIKLKKLLTEKKYQTIANLLFTKFNQNNLIYANCIINLIKHYPPEANSVFLEDGETLLKLIDLYLNENILGRLIIKDGNKIVEQHANRDALLAPENEQTKKHWQQHTRKVKLILAAIHAYCPAVSDYSSSELEELYKKYVNEHKRYFSADYSDDSDSDDELILNQKKAADTTKTKHFSEVMKCQDDDFWKKTKRVTKLNAGLTIKLAKVTKTLADKALKDAKTTITQNPLVRATIPAPSKNAKKYFVAKFRGLNYMQDRWSTAARRYHYKMQETGKPQFSEAFLKMLPFDFYTELSHTNDYTIKQHAKKLTAQAIEFRKKYQQLNTTGPFLAKTVKPKAEYYVFDTPTDYLQHNFSNGIHQHLLQLKNCRNTDIFKIFPNAYNYAIATGDKPHHCLRYALGLKKYYHDNFKVQYNQDGSIVHSHAGKVLIILQEAGEFVSQDSCNRVLPSQYAGRVPLAKLITPELETSYIGYIPGKFIFHQTNIKFPSFHKGYKRIYEIKYGMDLELYTQFQRLIKDTQIESPKRDTVIELLKEWLCAYHEVLLLKIAEREASRRNGALIYVDYKNNHSTQPDIDPFTGGDANANTRNHLHLLQDIRWRLGELYSEYLTQEQTFGYVSLEHCKAGTAALIKSDDEILKLAKEITIPPVTTLYNATKDKKISAEMAKVNEARKILEKSHYRPFS